MKAPQDVTAIVDTREQQPFDLSPMKAVVGTLYTGDYSVAGLEQIIALERKSLADLVACVGRERERFERELMRLKAYPVSAVVVEASWHELELGDWRGKITPNHVLGSITAWIAQGHTVIIAGNRDMAQRVTRSILFHAAKYRWRESKAFWDCYQRSTGAPRTRPNGLSEQSTTNRQTNITGQSGGFSANR